MYNRVLFDTNALLDALEPSRPESDAVCEALELCNGYGDVGIACALSLRDVYYILFKTRGEKEARAAIKALVNLVFVAPTGGEESGIALWSSEPDFEDGLIRATAELNDVDFIITRDRDAFANSKIRSVTASEYVRIVKAEKRQMWEAS